MKTLLLAAFILTVHAFLFVDPCMADYRAGLHALIEKGEDDRFFHFAALHKGSPAREAGIKVGDQLIKIDGKEVQRMTSKDMMDAIGGEPGTAVWITVKRNGAKELLRFKVIRKAFKESVEGDGGID